MGEDFERVRTAGVTRDATAVSLVSSAPGGVQTVWVCAAGVTVTDWTD